MSIWGAIGDLGLAAAAPFTGGASLAFMPAVTGLDSSLSGSGNSGQQQGSSGGSSAAKYAQLAAFAPLLYMMLNKQQNPGQLISSIPGGQELLNQSITQSRQQAPVRQAAMQQALNTLPSTAFGAGGRPDLSTVPQANYGAAAGNDSSSALATTLKMLGAGAGGFMLGNNVGGSLDFIKKLFGGGGSDNSSGAYGYAGASGPQGQQMFTDPFGTGYGTGVEQVGDVFGGMQNPLPGALQSIPGLGGE